MNRGIALSTSIVALASLCFGQSPAVPPEPTNEIVRNALEAAGTARKNVMVIFHASWCSWCKKFEAVLDRPDVNAVVNKHYVIVRLDVLERGEKKALENPGGGEYLKELGGEKSGIPFYAFLNPNGEKLADSNVMPGNGNIGFPGAKEEAAAFAELLKSTAPRMTPEELNVVMKYFGR